MTANVELATDRSPAERTVSPVEPHGILAAADWLDRGPRAAGVHPFDLVVDELIARHPVAA